MFELLSCVLLLTGSSSGQTHELLGPCSRYVFEGRSLVFETSEGQRLRVTPYGAYMLRIQAVRRGEEFFPDDWYEMVETHSWPGSLQLTDDGSSFLVTNFPDSALVLQVARKQLRLTFFLRGIAQPLLSDSAGIWWDGNWVHSQFRVDPAEHFTGLGHGFYGRSKHLDLKGEIIERNYGSAHGQQAPLIVPFYLSSKGYGIFVNSTFPNSFSLDGANGYEFSLGGDARMDYFFVAGPEFAEILDRYTRLTGRPRFPPRAMFGLALSDKGHDHTSPTPSDEVWWKKKVDEHRRLGFPIDHLVNDNRWRACGGTRCESCFEWDTTRYPDPAEYERWIRKNGLVTTIDFNRCIARKSDGWQASFNIPQGDSIDFGDSAPDFTRRDVRSWFWSLFWRKSLNPKLGYPGDALWIDEFDEMGKAPSSMILGNGRSWLELRNYWFFLVAKSLVQEGWDVSIGTAKRPFVWVRGMTAGAQRYATLWSGDIQPSYADMQAQVRSMQLAGLGGFPYWGHDAGGFHDWQSGRGPDEAMYRNWSMALGSFTPFWKPHGMGQSRWPLDRSQEAQKDAHRYCELRYRLIPYLYTYAHEAHESGMPIARAMVINYRQDSNAWTHDLQYMWGDALLVAPNCSGDSTATVWLPQGKWYDFWSDEVLAGNRVIDSPSPVGRLPLFVRAGSIIPMVHPALSTAFIHSDTLLVSVYAGDDGTFHLYEDDGVTETFRTSGENRTTTFSFTDASLRVSISPAKGTYRGATEKRAYRIDIHGLSRPVPLTCNGVKLKMMNGRNTARHEKNWTSWDPAKRLLSVFLAKTPVTASVQIQRKASPEH